VSRDEKNNVIEKRGVREFGGGEKIKTVTTTTTATAEAKN